jgi:chloramphenicol-sensitive protein RarD
MRYAILAYFSWGLFPFYWKLLKHVPAWDIAAHRMVWSAVFLTTFSLAKPKNERLIFLMEIWKIFRQRRTLRLATLAALLIGTNWTLYVAAVTSGHVIDASLGYFINPLFNVVLGVLVLGEKLKKVEKVAVLFATIGVITYAVDQGRIPWLGLGLALTFGLYGLIRKILGISGWVLTTAETWLLFLPALFWLLYGHTPAVEPLDAPSKLLLLGGGIVTAMPIVWFTEAARRLPMTTLGFVQFMTPSILFLTAVGLYGEPCPPMRWAAFAWIWAGVAIYIAALVKNRQRRFKK